MLAAAPHPLPPGALTLPFPGGAVGVRAATLVRGEPTVWVDEVRRWAVVVDARLHNRAELSAALGLAPGAGDAQLMGWAAERWRDDFAAHVVGDFAVVFCDWGNRQVVLATGMSAARSLFYDGTDPAAVTIATDPDQLRGPHRSGSADVDDEMVAEYLAGQHRDPARTFFRSIKRVVPGHAVTLRRGSSGTRRFFLPPPPSSRSASLEDSVAEFAGLFRQVVRDAVDPRGLHLAHLSGGLDSSAIVGALVEIAPATEATFETITGVFSSPALRSCNESAAVAAVRRRTPFPARTWDAELPPDLDREMDLVPWPLGVLPMAIANSEDVDVAARAGAVALISGDFGDGLSLETAVVEDLVRHREWRMLWNQLGARGLAAPTRRRLLGRALRSTVSRRGNPWPRLRSAAPSAWAVPSSAAADAGPSSADASVGTAPVPASAVAREVWTFAIDPTSLAAYEMMQMRAARAGVDLRSPYRDPRLLSFVLSLPWRHRLPDGQMRRLQREGLADLIPEEVRRRSKVTFEAAVHALYLKERPAMERMFSSTFDNRNLFVARHMDPTWARRALASAVGDPSDKGARTGNFQAFYALRRVWTLELWLRRLMR